MRCNFGGRPQAKACGHFADRLGISLEEWQDKQEFMKEGKLRVKPQAVKPELNQAFSVVLDEAKRREILVRPYYTIEHSDHGVLVEVKVGVQHPLVLTPVFGKGVLRSEGLVLETEAQAVGGYRMLGIPGTYVMRTERFRRGYRSRIVLL